MRFRILYFLMLIFTNFACSSEDSKSINDTFVFEDIYTFKNKKNLSIELDSLTYTGNSCSQYFEQDTASFFIFNNPKTNTIYIHEFKNFKYVRKIILPFDGSMGVGQMEGYYVHNFDSIFIPSTSHQTMYMVNIEGRILQKYKYKLNNKNDVVQIMFSSYNKPSFIDNKLYCATPPQGNKDKSSTVQVLNLNNKEWTSMIPLSQKYDEGFYGAPNFYNTYKTVNYLKKNIYISFPVDNYIYEISAKDKVNKYYAGSKYLKDVKPMAKRTFQVLFQDYDRFFRKSPSYSSIIYDKYRDIYYRIAQRGISNDLIDSKDNLKNGLKPFSIIVLNNKFRKVGEITLPDYTYAWQCIIPVREGVLIKNFKTKRDKEDDDHDYFDLFEVVENKK
ncbi:MAG: DUF4221 domain-containing protein [Bacteroidetes bacterium]|nr:MAG: DUF4221 domain-containing protein [Bacteroidota bacterium]